ncbi:DinB family protein [Gorillibacterium timonense]|uniref:DinB family protein n=1 Tax=Gorillibacterium timonense TaxID=1689269 RepID=UPI00071C6FAC|nr:DinB family protein [Gorillibacterium timonense]
MSIHEELENRIRSSFTRLLELSEEEFAKKERPEKWSKKEILGHLCDSAANNHYRFVRAAISKEPIKIESYQQNEWVALHGYQTFYTGSELVALWQQANKQILCVLKTLTDEQYGNPLYLADGSSATLEWLVDDYLQHLMHHMNQIFPDTPLRDDDGVDRISWGLDDQTNRSSSGG